MLSNLHVSVLLLSVFPVKSSLMSLASSIISISVSPVIDGDELEEVLALPLAGDEHHQGASSGSVAHQAGHERLEHPELGGSGQHYRGLSENIKYSSVGLYSWKSCY